MLAQATQVPEFEISEDEGKSFMVAAQNVARHYSIETTQKSVDIASLIGVALSIYGVRVAAYNIRRHQERAEKQAAGTPPSNHPAPFVVVPNGTL